MDSLLISLNAVAPLFLFLALGYLLRRWELLDSSAISRVSRLTHYVFLPALLFQNIVDSGLAQGLPWGLVLIAAASSTLGCLLSVGLASLVEGDHPRRAALAQGMFRNNYVTFGIAIATAIYGAGAAGLVSMLIACIVPLNNIYAVAELTVLRRQRLSFRRLMREIVANPFVIAAALGFAVALLPWQLPAALGTTLSGLSGAGIPLSMLMLGASFTFTGLGGYARDIVVGVLTKLVLLPLCFIPIYLALGIRGESLLVLFVALATPPAASSHVMAGQMGADSTLAGHLIVFGSAVSVVTLFAWLWLLKSLAFL